MCGILGLCNSKGVSLDMTEVATGSDINDSRAYLHKLFAAQTWLLAKFFCLFYMALVAAVYFIAKHTP